MSARGDRSQHKYQPMRRGVAGYKGAATDEAADPTRVFPEPLVAAAPGAEGEVLTTVGDTWEPEAATGGGAHPNLAAHVALGLATDGFTYVGSADPVDDVENEVEDGQTWLDTGRADADGYYVLWLRHADDWIEHAPQGFLANPDEDVSINVAGPAITMVSDGGAGATLDGDAVVTQPALDAVLTGAFQAVLDGGGGAIAAGQEADIEVPYACILTGWTLLADQTGSIVVDVWRDTFANYPPTDADSIAASHELTLAAAAKATDADIEDWSAVELAAGDVLRLHVDSAATVQRVLVSLHFTRS